MNILPKSGGEQTLIELDPSIHNKNMRQIGVAHKTLFMSDEEKHVCVSVRIDWEYVCHLKVLLEVLK